MGVLVLSAANRKAGYAPQIWLGIGPVRVRLISAHLQPPDGFAGAHSTVRALFGAYAGSLYQVRRASDKTTKDICTPWLWDGSPERAGAAQLPDWLLARGVTA